MYSPMYDLYMNPDLHNSCGGNDTETFLSNEQCCGCGGGEIQFHPGPWYWEQDVTELENLANFTACFDTEGNYFDREQNLCGWYTRNSTTKA